jgi:hypothetical protein
MIVGRWLQTIRRGHLEEATAAVNEMLEAFEGFAQRPTRVYTSSVGTGNTAATEIEFESLAEYESVLAEFSASPEAASFFEKWHKLTEGPGSNEICLILTESCGL